MDHPQHAHGRRKEALLSQFRPWLHTTNNHCPMSPFVPQAKWRQIRRLVPSCLLSICRRRRRENGILPSCRAPDQCRRVLASEQWQGRSWGLGPSRANGLGRVSTLGVGEDIGWKAAMVAEMCFKQVDRNMESLAMYHLSLRRDLTSRNGS